ncbi:MAG: alpha/beta hydrolase [Deltaproteobacteria bacterium]|nr:alpha/beta hydrolase [Deltaproteobacteria bacterium]
MPIKIILWTLLFYLVYCGFLFIMQRQILFPRYLIDAPYRSEDHPFMEKIWIKTSFGKTEAWFLPPNPTKKAEPSPTVIFAHGNGELIDFWPDELKRFNHFGIGVMLLEYPGYGRSEGTPSQKNITETFNNAYNILIERKDVDPAKIILFGRSLGGGAVCTLAAERPSAALILMSTFTSARSFAKKYFAPGFLVRDPFNNLAVVRNYPEPVLVFHGKFDEVIPYSHGMALYKSALHATMITYESGHNDCPPDWETFWRDLEEFLNTSGIIKNIGSSPD